MFKGKLILFSGLVASSLVVSIPAHGDENMFGYVYGSETLPKGGLELYQWVTRRDDKGQGTYRAYDFNTELEYGFTDRFQGSVYLNARSHKIAGSAPVEDGSPEYPDRDSAGFDGIKASFKYSLLSPYKDDFGLALYVEPGYSKINSVSGRPQNGKSLELKVITQKNFMDDQLIWAFNLSPEFEWNHFKDDGSNEKELEVEASTGLSYRFAPHWSAGIEGRYSAVYPNFNGRETWALFAGPNIHYGGKHWWWTATWFPQIKGGPTDPTRSSYLQLDENEKTEYRLKVGYEF